MEQLKFEEEYIARFQAIRGHTPTKEELARAWVQEREERQRQQEREERQRQQEREERRRQQEREEREQVNYAIKKVSAERSLSNVIRVRLAAAVHADSSVARSILAAEASPELWVAFLPSADQVAIQSSTSQSSMSKFSISGANQSRAAAVVESTGFESKINFTEDVVASVNAEDAESKFSPFSWSGSDERSQSEQVTGHVRTLLKDQYGAPIGKEGYDVVDVHENRGLLSTVIGNVQITGGTDAVIVPHSVHAGSPLQLRGLLEYKATGNKKLGFGFAQSQGIVELVCALAKSHHPVFVLVTDVNTAAHLFVAQDESIKFARDLKPGIALAWVARHLRDNCSPAQVYNEIRLNGPHAHMMKRVKLAQPQSALDEQLEILDELPEAERRETRLMLVQAFARAALPEGMYT